MTPARWRSRTAEDTGIITGSRSGKTRALPAECTPGPSHNERTGTRRPGFRDVLPGPSVGTFTVESKRARSTGPTRRWTVPECARIPAWGIAPMCRSRAGNSRERGRPENGLSPNRIGGRCGLCSLRGVAHVDKSARAPNSGPNDSTEPWWHAASHECRTASPARLGWRSPRGSPRTVRCRGALPGVSAGPSTSASDRHRTMSHHRRSGALTAGSTLTVGDWKAASEPAFEGTRHRDTRRPYRLLATLALGVPSPRGGIRGRWWDGASAAALLSTEPSDLCRRRLRPPMRRTSCRRARARGVDLRRHELLSAPSGRRKRAAPLKGGLHEASMGCWRCGWLGDGGR